MVNKDKTPERLTDVILKNVSSRRRNEEIEVLRAVAVLFTVVEHINILLFWRTTDFGNIVNLYGGVDLFFCISGFVITSAFADEIAEIPNRTGALRANSFGVLDSPRLSNSSTVLGCVHIHGGSDDCIYAK